MAVIETKLTKEDMGYEGGRTSVSYEYQVHVSLMADLDAVVAAAVIADASARLDLTGTYIIDDQHVKRRKENPLYWDVEMRISSMIWPDNQPVPTLRASTLSSSYDEQTEAYFLDCSATPKLVLNSAGERFEAFPTRRTGTPNLQIEKNYASYSMVGYAAIVYTTNAAAVTIKGTTYAANTLLFLPPLVQEMVENVAGVKYHYYKVTFRLACDANHHTDTIDDRGYKAFDGLGFLNDITLSNGTMSVPASPYPLDGSGHKKTNASDAPYQFLFHPYVSVSWGIDFS